MPSCHASDAGRRKPSLARCWLPVESYPQAPNYKLGTLVEYAGLPLTGRYHRAQADAEMAAHLTLYLEQALMERFGLSDVTHELLGQIQRSAKTRLEKCVERYGRRCP